MRIHCLFRPQAVSFANDLQDCYGNIPIEECEVIVVLGGDGFMLHQIHHYMGLGKPFYGINFGTRGALMNPLCKAEEVVPLIERAQNFSFRPLKFMAKDQEGKIIQGHAVNEVTIQRLGYHSIRGSIFIDGNLILGRASGDGVLIATPLGSAAYNASAGGPILSLGVPALVVTPLNFADPQGWPSHVIPEDSSIEITLLEAERRPAYIGADVNQYNNITQCKIEKDSLHQVTLLFSHPWGY